MLRVQVFLPFFLFIIRIRKWYADSTWCRCDYNAVIGRLCVDNEFRLKQQRDFTIFYSHVIVTCFNSCTYFNRVPYGFNNNRAENIFAFGTPRKRNRSCLHIFPRVTATAATVSDYVQSIVANTTGHPLSLSDFFPGRVGIVIFPITPSWKKIRIVSRYTIIRVLLRYTQSRIGRYYTVL
jgi:hypothetical protein